MPAAAQVDVCLLDWNRRNVGIREATNENDGEFVQRFLKSCNLAGNYSWCACYTLSGHLTCGVLRKDLPLCAAYSPCWFDKNVVWTKGDAASKLKPGDVFGLWSSSKNRVAHVGFIVAVYLDKGYVLTIEGNTRDAGNKLQPGDGVHLMRRSISELYIASNWRPQDTRYHTVQRQETLYKLSQMYGVSVEQIKQWNNLQSEILSIGQQVRVG